jgi:hypothetical protein
MRYDASCAAEEPAACPRLESRVLRNVPCRCPAVIGSPAHRLPGTGAASGSNVALGEQSRAFRLTISQ